ncbi:hypothetical protein D9M69_723600 [compost metagenome]
MPQVEPEGFHRVVERQTEIGFDQQVVDEQHAHDGAEHADPKAAVQGGQRRGQGQGDETPARFGRGQSHADPGRKSGDQKGHHQACGHAVLFGSPVDVPPPDPPQQRVHR